MTATDLDLRRLRYFLVLADELNYGRAAELLHIAQPALSRAITALERELGVTLFDRSRSGTRLAPAGELLREEARQLLQSVAALRRRVRAADRLTIGFAPGVILTPLVRRLEQHFPGLQVDVVRTSWLDQVAGLRDGRFDASFAHRPFDADGLVVVPVRSEPRLAVLGPDHPYAGKSELTLPDLAGDVLLQPGDAVPEWRGRVEFARASSVEAKFEQVGAGRGILVVPASVARYYQRPDLAFVPVSDLPEVEVCLLVEQRRDSAVLRELVRIADADPASVEA